MREGGRLRGRVEEDAQTHTQIHTYPHMMIVSSYAIQLYILVLLPLLHLQIVLSINPISCLPFFLFFLLFMFADAHAARSSLLRQERNIFTALQTADNMFLERGAISYQNMLIFLTTSDKKCAGICNIYLYYQ